MKRILAGIFMLTVISTQAQTEPATKNFKYDFFSPVAGCFGFDLETWYRNSVTMEYKAGLIGLKLGDYFGNEQFIGGYFSIGLNSISSWIKWKALTTTVISQDSI